MQELQQLLCTKTQAKEKCAKNFSTSRAFLHTIHMTPSHRLPVVSFTGDGRPQRPSTASPWRIVRGIMSLREIRSACNEINNLPTPQMKVKPFSAASSAHDFPVPALRLLPQLPPLPPRRRDLWVFDWIIIFWAQNSHGAKAYLPMAEEKEKKSTHARNKETDRFHETKIERASVELRLSVSPHWSSVPRLGRPTIIVAKILANEVLIYHTETRNKDRKLKSELIS